MEPSSQNSVVDKATLSVAQFFHSLSELAVLRHASKSLNKPPKDAHADDHWLAGPRSKLQSTALDKEHGHLRPSISPFSTWHCLRMSCTPNIPSIHFSRIIAIGSQMSCTLPPNSLIRPLGPISTTPTTPDILKKTQKELQTTFFYRSIYICLRWLGGGWVSKLVRSRR
jgi:hypothetical protein